MALDFLGHGLSITSETSPLAPTVIQGGDLLNLTFHLDYNGTNDVLLENSTACQELNNRTVFIDFVITLPVFFDIIYPINMSNHNGSIVTNFSNCSVTPSLEINSSVFRSDIQGFNVIKFDILSQNVSWVSSLDVQLRLLHSAKSGSFLNITANVTVANETWQFNIPSYRTPIPGNLQLEVTSTSFPETPNVTLTSEEEVTLSATFHLPKITANLTLVITFHTFGNSTPMRYVRGSVQSLSPGVTSQKLDVGLPPEFSTSGSNLHRFPHPNVAKFVFGDTINTASEPSDGVITVEVTGMVDSTQGVYVPDSEGNVTCILMYYSSRGYNIVANETFFTLKLGQPLLERDFMIQGSACCYEGNDMVELDFEVKNPVIATAPAFNVTIDIVVSSSEIAVHSIMVMLCENVSICTDLMGTDMVTNSSSGLIVSLSRLNSSSWVKGSLVTLVKPSVAAKSFHPIHFTLVYTRSTWLPIHADEVQSIIIKSIMPFTPVVISSDIPHPSQDFKVITIGEDMAFRMKLSLPVSTNDNFTVEVSGPGVEGVTGRISHIGSNIQAHHGQIIGAAFNITPSSKISGNFGTIVNTGSSLSPSDSEIEYEATVRPSNGSMVTNGKTLNIHFEVKASGIGQPEYTQSLEVIEPDLSVSVTVSRSSGVPPNYELTYTVQLHHSKKSTSHAFRVLLEIAVPHEQLSKAKIMASPAAGVLTMVDGNQAPSGNPRYNNPNTKVLLYQADYLLLGQTVSFKYKATTISNLLPSISVSSPVHLAYVTLSKSLAPREGRKYLQNLDQGTFLTYRPSPFVSVTFEPIAGSFDAGDKVLYALTVKNVAQSTTAHDVSILAAFEALDANRVSVTCSTGSPTFNAISRESTLVISSIAPSQTVSCNYESYLQDRLSPKRLISQTVVVEYYSLPSGSRPAMSASYKEKRHANLTTKPINTTIVASQNAEELQAGDPVNFTLHLQLPECVTNLSVAINLPTVPRSVIDLSRRRRDVRGLHDGSSSEEAGRRSRVRRNAGLVYVLTSLLNESYIKYGNGFTLSQVPIITQVNDASLNVPFGLIENLPGSGPDDTVEIFLKFRTANDSLVLSGRPVRLAAVLKFDAGSDNLTKTFMIVGPLLKPLLSINKTVKVLEQEGDSPPVAFNVTISHASGSLYDARDLIVTDSIQGMDIYDSDISTKGVLISHPRKNTIKVRFLLPGLRIGETRSFIFVAHFRVEQKEPSTLRIPAEVAWKSVQLNSPTYRLQSDASTACLQRNDLDKAEPRKVFGFFALGVLLGLFFGAVIAAIVMFVVIKCCDKGKMAPYYMRFTNTSTMTVLTGGSQYIYHGEELPRNNPIEKHSETSIVQTDESIVPILSLDNATQTEKELNSLDVQATAALDADLETRRQNMFVKAVKLLARKLRVKREISSEQESNFCLEIKQAIGAVAFKMAAEYRRKSAGLRKKLQKEGKNCLDALHREQRNEREETESKIKGLVNEREKKNILELLKKRHEAQEQELKQNLKLEQDVEMEKLRKEVSISKRFALKEAQNKMIQNLIKDAKLNEEQANAIIKDHLANMAAIDKATDEERARRVMALEMRLAERRALARQKQEEEERKKQDSRKLEENHADAFENLVRSSTVSSEDAALYLQRYRKKMEVINSKLAKDRKRQEQKLHQKLTALKQKKIEEKAREHQRQIKEFEEKQDEKFEQVEIDTVAAINEKQKILEQQRREIEEIERNSDREAAKEVENFRDQQTREANQLMKNNAQKMYQELVNKGLSESEKEAMLERHMADLAMQQEVREEERRRQTQLLERRLEKQRALLENKMKEEQAEQAEVRRQEDKIVGDLIVNQVVMSEEERDRIIQEHEKNLAELESSLTLSKLRQRQLLEEKLAKRRKRRMEQLEKRQMDETKHRDRDYDDKILAEGEDIEMIKKHEQEKIEAIKEDEIHLEDEMETVREEMLAERSKKLEEHHEKLGAIIAQLQIEKAKQMSKIAMQQEALDQLQAGLVDELESKGTFQDPETQKIMEKYQMDTKNLEENLKVQKERQEKALRERLQERMRQREETLVLQQKDELSRYMSTHNASNMAMKLRKAAVKARQQNQLNELRNRMQKEIDQSINELKMASDIRRMQAIEAQNIELISILVQQGKLQEEELEGVLSYLFPTKSSNEIDELLSKIYGPDHNKGSSGHTSLDARRPSTLEARIRRQSSVPNTSPPTIRKPSKKKKKSKKNEEEEPKDLPPINFKSGSRKGFNLNESLRGYRSFTDEEQNSTRSEPRGGDSQRHSPNVSRNGSYRPLTEENSQGLVDEMLGESPEESRKKSGKKRKKRRKRDDEDVIS